MSCERKKKEKGCLWLGSTNININNTTGNQLFLIWNLREQRVRSVLQETNGSNEL